MSLRSTIVEDKDVDLKEIKSQVENYYSRGAYNDKNEMIESTKIRIGCNLMGWGKYSHLDSETIRLLEKEVENISEDIVNDILKD